MIPSSGHGLDKQPALAHARHVTHAIRIRRAAGLLIAAALAAAPVVHASHGHDAAPNASPLHATCVVCHVGSPVATQPVAVHATTDAPVCHLSIADRDHAIPPARVDVDLSRAPPAFLAS